MRLASSSAPCRSLSHASSTAARSSGRRPAGRRPRALERTDDGGDVASRLLHQRAADAVLLLHDAQAHVLGWISGLPLRLARSTALRTLPVPWWSACRCPSACPSIGPVCAPSRAWAAGVYSLCCQPNSRSPSCRLPRRHGHSQHKPKSATRSARGGMVLAASFPGAVARRNGLPCIGWWS